MTESSISHTGDDSKITAARLYHAVRRLDEQQQTEVNRVVTGKYTSNDPGVKALAALINQSSEVRTEFYRYLGNPSTVPAVEDLDSNQPKTTDIANSDRFATMHRNRLRYVHVWGWLSFDGQRWTQDSMGQVVELAKETVRGMYAEAAKYMTRAGQRLKDAGTGDDQDKVAEAMAAAKAKFAQSKAIVDWAIKSQSRPRLDAMISLAQSEPGIACKPDVFDLDPWLLNCQNGVLDLHTGELMNHSPELMITKITGTIYDPWSECPTWLAFLDRIFSGDAEMIAFIQRAVGYALTGDTGEQCLFFLFGKGANGKSTLTQTLQVMLGDYATRTPAETLMIRQNSGVNNDVARLAGARFVVGSELAEGRRLDEPLVKDLVGADTMTARFLHREFFEFVPQFKLFLYGNHRPEIRGTDDGIWRRLRAIPFEVTIPPAEQDHTLLDKLKAELPGILAWAVRGCMDWQQIGLNPPEKVSRTTEEYRAEMDLIGNFLAECTVDNYLASVTNAELYNAYVAWAQESKVAPVSKIDFSKRMSERGFASVREAGTGRAKYTGIGLLAKDETA